MKLRSSDTGRKYTASRCPRVMTRATTAQTIKSAAKPPVRISRFFLRRHKIICPNGFLYAKHTIRRKRLQGKRLVAYGLGVFCQNSAKLSRNPFAENILCGIIDLEVICFTGREELCRISMASFTGQIFLPRPR